MKLNTLILTLTLSTLAQASFAAAPMSTLVDLTARLTQLNPSVERDLDRGSDLAADAYTIVSEFSNGPARSKTNDRYAAIIELAAAALPYSTESEIAVIAEGEAFNVPRLQRTYTETVAKLPPCQKGLWNAMLKEADEAAEAESSGRMHQRGYTPTAPRIFNFKACVAGQKR